ILQKVITHDFKFCLFTLGVDNLYFVCLYCTCFCTILLIVLLNFLYRLLAKDGHFNLVPLAGLSIFAGIIAAGMIFMVFSAITIVSFLRASKAISAKTRKLQFGLFRMLACQTIIPVVLMHGCAGAQLFVPLFGFNIELYSDVSTVFLSFFTPLDSLVVILLMKDYREAVLSIFPCFTRF
ncbi:hypothetical protein PFISCL1PPCAC_18869, partial [Pristionchus fissidentatus]